MGFYNERFRWHDDYEVRKLYEEKERLAQEIEDMNYRQRQQEWEQMENEKRARIRRQEIGDIHEAHQIAIEEIEQDWFEELEDLKLRIKFGVEVDV